MKLTVDETQAQIINSALDLYSRLLCGELSTLTTFFAKHNSDLDLPHDELFSILREIKSLVFPDLSASNYCVYGIYQEEAPEQAKVAYDLFQVIRNHIAWKNKPEGGIEVDFHEPMNTSEKTPLAKIKP